MAELSSFYEGIDSVSPTTIRVTQREAGDTRTYYLLGVTDPEDVTNAYKQILGDVDVSITGDQKLHRTLPVADPQTPIWTARGLVARGLGTFTRITPSTFITGGPQVMGDYALYSNYEFTVDFAQEPYAILEDYMIDIPNPPPQGDFPGFWFDIDAFTGSELQRPWLYASEWQRFVDYDLIPQDNYVTATKGSSYFVTGDDASPGGAGARIGGTLVPHIGKSFKGMPRIYLPNQIFRLTWRMVPLRYYQSARSYLKKYKGRVNQFDWYEVGSRKLFPKGSLLYLGCTPKIYTPPVLAIQGWANGDLVPPKVCDYELTFMTTDRIISGSQPVYTDGAATSRVPRRNFIAAGINLQPFLDMGQSFFYVVFNSDKAQNPRNVPYFLSFPVELLFTDPDAPQPGE